MLTISRNHSWIHKRWPKWFTTCWTFMVNATSYQEIYGYFGILLACLAPKKTGRVHKTDIGDNPRWCQIASSDLSIRRFVWTLAWQHEAPTFHGLATIHIDLGQKKCKTVVTFLTKHAQSPDKNHLELMEPNHSISNSSGMQIIFWWAGGLIHLFSCIRFQRIFGCYHFHGQRQSVGYLLKTKYQHERVYCGRAS